MGITIVFVEGLYRMNGNENSTCYLRFVGLALGFCGYEKCCFL